jgi:hypothetical protein
MAHSGIGPTGYHPVVHGDIPADDAQEFVKAIFVMVKRNLDISGKIGISGPHHWFFYFRIPKAQRMEL